jgi:hypothetical protein
MWQRQPVCTVPVRFFWDHTIDLYLTGGGGGGGLTLCWDQSGQDCRGQRPGMCLYPGWPRGPPKFLRVADVFIQRLYAVQGQDTSVRDESSKGRIAQGTYNPRKNIRGRYIQGRIAMASLNWTHSVGDSRCPATFPLACTRCEGHTRRPKRVEYKEATLGFGWRHLLIFELFLGLHRKR